MRKPPPYFEEVRRDAQRRWDQLDADPELAAPWHQLFRQVQSPRHVLSELLQNADDAGATWARVHVTDGAFVFEHDGVDFDDVAFRSLCRFGFSNKRHLHTIGFRGIGFKSTFSVGPTVELRTPTLDVAFDDSRFTEPRWIDSTTRTSGTTEVRIGIRSIDVQSWLEAEIQRWSQDPIPILFFRHLQSLDLQGTLVGKDLEGPGPVANSEWVQIQGTKDLRVLHVWSEEEAFPADALEEVRAERGDPEFELPPCRVDVVTGVPDPRLYVVLPTEVQLDLPFACQAPFMQDPARARIKDPTGSATNRWLLRRTGQLAARALREWIENEALTAKERAASYTSLLPKSAADASRSLAYDVSATVRDGIRETIGRGAVVLTAGGRAVPGRAALDVPAELLGVWEEITCRSLFGQGHVGVVAPEVREAGRRRLAAWDLLDRFDDRAFLERMATEPTPLRPETDGGLVRLWAFVERLLSQDRFRRLAADALAIVPTGEDLEPASRVVVGGAAGDKLGPEDWAFIASFVPLADAEWLRALAASGEREDAPREVLAAARLLRDLRLASRTGVQEAVLATAGAVFRRDDPGLDGVRVAHLAARADLQVPPDFRYLCQDGGWRPATDGLLVDIDGSLLDTGADWARQRLVADAYRTAGGTREQTAWARWAGESRSRLRRFLIPTEAPVRLYGRSDMETFATERGGHVPTAYSIKSQRFEGTDYDFPSDVWVGWEAAAREDNGVWAAVCRGIIQDWDEPWKRRSSMRMFQKGTSTRHAVDHGVLAAAWVNRLQGCACLPDTEGRMRTPAELFRTNARTAHLVGVEPFLDEAFDTEVAAPLLDVLGVRDTPDSADRLLDRLRALSGSAVPSEVVSGLYVALDRSVGHLGRHALEAVQAAFAEEALIRSVEGTWHRADSVVQRNDEEIPGLMALPEDVASLKLWDQMGVSRQPSADGILGWLRSLPSGVPLSPELGARVRAVLPRLPQRVWEDVGAWIDAIGAWTPTEAFEYGAADEDSFRWLFEGFRRSVADLTMLPEALRTQSPFASVAPLSGALGYRVGRVDPVGDSETRGWVIALAEGLLRADPKPGVAPEVVTRRRQDAARLAQTRWQEVGRVEAEPTVDERPVGPRKAAEVLWVDDTLYAAGDGPRVHEALVRALSAPFEEAPMRKAIEACVGRPTDWIRAYMDSTFVLDASVPRPVVPAVETFAPASDETATEAPTMTDPLSLDIEEGGRSDETTTGTPTDPSESDPDDITMFARRTRVEGPAPALAAYWRRQGFQSDGPRAFVHPDGRRVEREGGVFPWVEWDPSRSTLGRYWVSRQALETGVDLPAEVWDLLRQGEDYILLIPSAEGRLDRFGWDRIKPRLEAGTVTLYASGYRLHQPDREV